MSEEGSNTWQLRFENGDLSEPPESVGSATDPPVSPGVDTGYTVTVNGGALEVNERLETAVDAHGRTLEFGTRTQAELYTEWLSTGDRSLRLQAAAANEPADVDAYLLASHDPSVSEPVDTDDESLTFDVGANLYGALGEALLLDGPKPYALRYVVRRDLGISESEFEERFAMQIDRGTTISLDDDDGSVNRWIPDCTITVRDGWEGPLVERYYCEIKTGDASFQRSQMAAMQELAKSERVFKIRVRIDSLPEQYSLRVDEVSPPE
jgi:hypothetical protein